MSDVVTLDRAEYTQLVADAEAWRAVTRSPHVMDLLGEWREWRLRRDMSASTACMASLENWRAVASAPTYAELERRRRGRPRPSLRCDHKLCTADGNPHRSPQTGAQIVLCAEHSHLAVPESVPAGLAVVA
ncbi:hypothetical protein BJF85_00205 [Saccharomonospora sp. CUA-673]|uniref:hypothetical protein n=1 Tax=Saccharomonospora sp. CUA-673 TaxID=1904969 RepID=UPI0009620511|nr:hypothetical protein [Saccharomonospora sp. CUA-673]OLT46933.1 hypothetical protein BJF85_00205 [Saccharomonospora sp. CUA-673]